MKVDNISVFNFSGDITSKKDVEKMKNSDIIFHFAGSSNIWKSIQEPLKSLQTNIIGTFNILELMRKNPIKRLVCISSVEVYGEESVILDKKTWLLDPTNPYAASKASADLLCHSFFKTYGVPVVILRLGTQYGPRQRPDKAIPLFIKNVLEGKPIPIFGDGREKRPWTYVMDTVEGIYKAGVKKGIEGKIYNFGAKREASVFEVVEIISNLLNDYNPQIKFLPEKTYKREIHFPVSLKTKRELGWHPKTSLKEGLKKTVDWYLKNGFPSN